MTHLWKLDLIRRKMADLQLDSFLLSDLHVIRWLSGFSGSSARVLLSHDRAVLFTDFRYREQVAEEVDSMECSIIDGGFLNAFAESGVPGPERLGIEKDVVSVGEFERLRARFDRLAIVPVSGFFDEFRMIKDAAELGALRQAARITEQTLEKIVPMISPEVTELDIAAEISYWHRRFGAERDSFEPIVASGPRSAMPHARPQPEKIREGSLIVIDMGCVCNGYASDQTRTFALGKIPDEAAKIYSIVRDAQQLGLDSIRCGMAAKELDAIVRNAIASHGYGEAFGHSLGHGVGVEVHELPRVSSASEDYLHPTTVFTVEPGIYLPGRFGVRIEDTVVLHESGPEPLQRYTKQLVQL